MNTDRMNEFLVRISPARLHLDDPGTITMNTQHHARRLTIRQSATTLTAILCLATCSWAAELSPLEPLRAEMRAEHYDQAIVLADKIIAAKDPKADEAYYLQALALFHAKKFPEAATATDQLSVSFPQSAWRFKATFLKAQSLIEQKQFQQAAALYQSEATRLLAADRKQELVGVIVGFADKLTAKPDPNVPDAPQPDFQKAYNLYTKALGMEISRDFRDELVFKKARAIQQAGNFGQAVQDFQAYLTEFDPAWTGPAGSGTARLPLQNPPPAGKHVAMARYRLAESQIQAGNMAAGRMELEDLLKRVNAPVDESVPLQAELATEEGKKLPADIRWLMVQSYFTQPAEVAIAGNAASQQGQQAAQNVNYPNAMVQGQVIGNTGGLPTTDTVLFVLREGELDQAIKTCREFLAACPEGSRAVSRRLDDRRGLPKRRAGRRRHQGLPGLHRGAGLPPAGGRGSTKVRGGNPRRSGRPFVEPENARIVPHWFDSRPAKET